VLTPHVTGCPLQFCRLAALPANYPLSSPGGGAIVGRVRPSLIPSQKPRPAARGLLALPASCATQGVLCDQDSTAAATILTYTGSGLSYQGTPLVQSPGSGTLLLSADPACSVAGGDKLTFPPVALCEWQLLWPFHCGCSCAAHPGCSSHCRCLVIKGRQLRSVCRCTHVHLAAVGVGRVHGLLPEWASTDLCCGRCLRLCAMTMLCCMSMCHLPVALAPACSHCLCPPPCLPPYQPSMSPAPVSHPPPAAPPPTAGPPLTPLIPINILNATGNPVRNNNLTNFAYVGPNDGVTDPPEVYFAYHPANPSNSTPIAPGETTYLKSAQTGKVGRWLGAQAGCCCPCWLGLLLPATIGWTLVCVRVLVRVIVMAPELAAQACLPAFCSLFLPAL
jgi:hypothetical protein